ncbi:SDR family oxidoreductase [Deinococcus sp. KSM4-11]|uniref:SDR family oxidoreductase n=1 Tax=Deinococcus sp. KSM4-11 TaxID=2568654 RepID=UPI0010A578E4|nr:SDR family oxidoreductase [Deinococcus sp. KSM4-11]THF85772.1 SDR family oxidoreductase [Deinococcus sp. KSM4-11]
MTQSHPAQSGVQQPPTIAITGATGHLGRLVVQALLNRGVPASSIAALVRDPAKATDLAAQGVHVRQADYTQPDTLGSALTGIHKLLLISSSDMTDRPGQHRNVIEAAKTAGVQLIAYTSILNADTTTMLLAADHQATETALRASGLPFTLLRDGWYFENYTGTLAQTLPHGVMLGAASDGQLTPATRQDYAEAAAAVLATDGHENATYELGGDETFTLDQIAAEISRQSGQPYAYVNQSVPEYTSALIGFGLPAGLAGVLADSDAAIARGDLRTDSGDLRRLIGRPSTSLTDAVAAALQG